MDNDFIGAYIELTPSENKKGVDVRFGWEGLDEMDEDTVELLKNLVAGLFGLVASQEDEVVDVGRYVRMMDAFKSCIEEVHANEVILPYDHDLLSNFNPDIKLKH